MAPACIERLFLTENLIPNPFSQRLTGIFPNLSSHDRENASGFHGRFVREISYSDRVDDMDGVV